MDLKNLSKERVVEIQEQVSKWVMISELKAGKCLHEENVQEEALELTVVLNAGIEEAAAYWLKEFEYALDEILEGIREYYSQFGDFEVKNESPEEKKERRTKIEQLRQGLSWWVTVDVLRDGKPLTSEELDRDLIEGVKALPVGIEEMASMYVMNYEHVFPILENEVRTSLNKLGNPEVRENALEE